MGKPPFKRSLVFLLLLLFYNSVFGDFDLPNRKPNGFQNLQQRGNSSGAFVQIPHSNPPTVRSPPYTISNDKCPDMNMRENWVDTLCGDLNTGFVPQNPLGHKFLDGGTYPFDTIKNKTLEFFRRALPILKNNKSLPKVARHSTTDFQPPSEYATTKRRRRVKRGIATRQSPPSYPSPLSDPYFPDDNFAFHPDVPNLASRRRRQYGPGHNNNQNNHNRFCENAMNYYNRLCKIYNAMWGKAPHNLQRDASKESRYYNHHPHKGKSNRGGPPYPPRPSIDVTVIEPSKTPKNMNMNVNMNMNMNQLQGSPTSQPQPPMEMPPTPCPSSAEYMTPVFARNHEGAWRYVVQIPKEGYFTQTVEVTKCLKSSCFYMEGSCKTSPRWQSLLVAELYYPDANFATTPHQYLQERSDLSTGGSSSSSNSIAEGNNSKTDPSQCDGYDGIGCYQVRLFYDWFLIPGSCKCWKTQFDFTRSRRSQSSLY